MALFGSVSYRIGLAFKGRDLLLSPKLKYSNADGPVLGQFIVGPAFSLVVYVLAGYTPAFVAQISACLLHKTHLFLCIPDKDIITL